MFSRRSLLAGTAAIAAAAALPFAAKALLPDPVAWVHIKWLDADDPVMLWTRRVPAEIRLLDDGGWEVDFTPGQGTWQHFEVFTGDAAGDFLWAGRPYKKWADADHSHPLRFMAGERGTLCFAPDRDLVAICRTYGPDSLAEFRRNPYLTQEYKRVMGIERRDPVGDPRATWRPVA